MLCRYNLILVGWRTAVGSPPLCSPLRSPVKCVGFMRLAEMQADSEGHCHHLTEHVWCLGAKSERTFVCANCQKYPDSVPCGPGGRPIGGRTSKE